MTILGCKRVTVILSIACVALVALSVSLFVGYAPLKLQWPNQLAAPNAGITFRFALEHHWPGVAEPGRSMKKVFSHGGTKTRR